MLDPHPHTRTPCHVTQDFAGGHVRGAVNAPSELWSDDSHIDSLIDQHVAGKDMVVVHCMFSQQRGPRYGGCKPADSKGVTCEPRTSRGCSQPWNAASHFLRRLL